MEKEIIKRLSLHKVVSGETLANELGVSRMTISKKIKKLVSDGYDVLTIPNKGYILGSVIDLLDYEYIKARIDENIDLEIFETIDSTNTYAKNNLVTKKNMTLVISDEQTAGRGRLEKKFQSPKGTGIYMTLVLPCQKTFVEIEHLTCAVAVIVAEAIESFGSERVEIKWVNDLFMGGKKICGILTEATTDLDTATVDSLVIGIGINVRTVDFEAGTNATNIGVEVARNDLICEITNKLANMSNFGSYMDEYISRSYLDGKTINFVYNGEHKEGIVQCVNHDGNLVVQCSNETITLRAGEVGIGSNNV